MATKLNEQLAHQIWILHSKGNAKQRIEVGRLLIGENEMTFKHLANLYNKQNGTCANCGLPFQPYGDMDWLVSLKRKDIEETYTENNVVLICAEFISIDYGNTGWSRGKVDYVRSLFS